MSFTYQKSQDMVYLTSDVLAALPHLYCTKTGGTSTGPHDSLSFRYTDNTRDSVHENFGRAAAVLGGNFDDIVRTQQVHKARVEAVTEGHGYRIMADDNDGLLTNLPGVILGGFYADCQLIFFYDPVKKACGVAHSGWRGTVLDISAVTIEKMTAIYGTDPAHLICTIGPAICQDCFACDSDVLQAFQKAFGQEILRHFIRKGIKYHPNMGAITKERLLHAGVQPQNIDVCPICTCCGEENLYWSHRRNGENRGVHGGFVRLR